MNNEKDNIQVSSFFDGYSAAFDDIYEIKNKNFLLRYLNKKFRLSMYSRFKLTLDYIKEIQNCNNIIDIGCGPGRYSVELAKMGYAVLGIDIAEKMIEIAKKSNLNESKCKFLYCDYMEKNFSQKFDAAILMGFFDYINDPKIVFEKLKKETRYVLASFPKKWHWLTPQRSIRYKIRKCPLYFYSYKNITDILDYLSINKFKIVDNDREFFLFAEIN